MTTLKMNKLTEYRERRLMSRAELARKAELSPLTILKIENGQSCRPETARKIILGLGYSLNDKDELFQEIIDQSKSSHSDSKIRPKSKTKAKS